MDAAVVPRDVASSDIVEVGACDPPLLWPSMIPPDAGTFPHATRQVIDEQCQVVCDDGWGDCNHSLHDGCERDLSTDRGACGTCGVACGSRLTCRDGLCVIDGFKDLPPPRQIAPISLAVTNRVRPTLRWEMSDRSPAPSVRLELCADRRCERRLQTLDVVGTEVTLTDPLPAGPMFWRMTTRSAESIGRVVSPTWVLYVEPGTCPVSPFAIRPGDLDGDAIADSTVRSGRDIVLTYSSGIPPSSVSLPPDTCTPNPYGYCEHFMSIDAFSLGDLSGDGYGDLARRFIRTAGSPFSESSHMYSVHFGGPNGVQNNAVDPRVLSTAEQGYSAALWGIGDVDHDGYGDIMMLLANRGPGPDRGVHFVTHAGGSWSPPNYCGDDEVFTPIDLNGDAVPDAVIRPCPTFESLDLPPSASVFVIGIATPRGFAPPQPLPGCDALHIAATDVRPEGVSDVNCDGLTDVQVRSGDVGFTLLGGPDGLSAARCVAAP